MKKMFVILIRILAGCNKQAAEPIEVPEEVCYGKNSKYSEILDYDLVWSDEFNVDGVPDEEKWKIITGGDGFGNHELQYYKEDNVVVEDGLLIIEALKEDYSGREYTSAKLQSINEGNFKYGKVEVKAKLPYGTGTWPAIWMMPTANRYGGWPNSGEIDIMEHVGYDMNNVVGTVHTTTYNHTKGSQKGDSILLDDVSTEFHIYEMEWLPDKIHFKADGVTYFTFENKYRDCPSEDEWPFNMDFYLILNVAIGGDWGGAQGIDDEIFPQTMEIDYIRVYQAEEINNLEE